VCGLRGGGLEVLGGSLRRAERVTVLLFILYSLVFFVLVGVVLSVVRVNRIWGAASDWLAGRVVCEV
jgi:hypothetical protein